MGGSRRFSDTSLAIGYNLLAMYDIDFFLNYLN